MASKLRRARRACRPARRAARVTNEGISRPRCNGRPAVKVSAERARPWCRHKYSKPASSGSLPGSSAQGAGVSVNSVMQMSFVGLCLHDTGSAAALPVSIISHLLPPGSSDQRMRWRVGKFCHAGVVCRPVLSRYWQRCCTASADHRLLAAAKAGGQYNAGTVQPVATVFGAASSTFSVWMRKAFSS